MGFNVIFSSKIIDDHLMKFEDNQLIYNLNFIPKDVKKK